MEKGQTLEWVFFRPVLHDRELQVPSLDVPYGIASVSEEPMMSLGEERRMVCFTLRRTGARVLVPEPLAARSQRPVATPADIDQLTAVAAEKSRILSALPHRQIQAVLEAMLLEDRGVLDLAAAYRDARLLCEEGARLGRSDPRHLRLQTIAAAALTDELALVRELSPGDAAALLESIFS
jgi:hypothetical protein